MDSRGFSRKLRATLRRPGAVGRAPQPWARVATWLCLLLPLPSVAWRLAMLLGADVGFADAGMFRGERGPSIYVLALNGTEIVVGLACLGLVRPWGERIPHAVPGVGSRTIHRLLPTAMAGAGNALMYAIWLRLLASFVPVWLGARDGWAPDRGMDGGERALLLACYIPFLLWPLAITVAIIGYWRRRRPRPEDDRPGRA